MQPSQEKFEEQGHFFTEEANHRGVEQATLQID